MDVVSLSLSSPTAHLDAWHRLDRLWWQECLAGLEPPSRPESLAELDSSAAERRSGWVAVDGDTVVGAYLAIESLHEDLDVAYGAIVVAPEHRRRGVASALLAAARDSHLDSGRKRVESSVLVASPASSFAGSAGARLTQIELCNVLSLDDAPTDLGAIATAVAPGYALHRWQDRCPDEFVDAFAAAHDAMNDAPRSDCREDWSWTADRVRDSESHRCRAGFRTFTVAAVHVATGEVAGYTEILDTGRAASVVQEDTGVVRRHRGHGLGIALKAANLETVRTTLPHVRSVITWNAESNLHMLAVNQRLGFRPHSRWEEISLEL